MPGRPTQFLGFKMAQSFFYPHYARYFPQQGYGQDKESPLEAEKYGLEKRVSHRQCFLGQGPEQATSSPAVSLKDKEEVRLKSCYRGKNFPSIVHTRAIHSSPLSHQGGRLRLTCPSGPKKQDLGKALLSSLLPATLLSVRCTIPDTTKALAYTIP